MKVDKNGGRHGGFFLQLLTLLFIALKLTGYINWSWLWVLSPLWITLTIILIVAILIGIIESTI